MSISVIKQEAMSAATAGVSLSSGSPGGFDSFAGTMLKRTGGPRLSTDTSNGSAGGSADIAQVTGNNPQEAPAGTFTLPTPQQSLGALSCFYFVDSFNISSGNPGQLIELIGSNTNYCQLNINPSVNGNFWAYIAGITTAPFTMWTNSDSGVAIPIASFVEIRIAWQLVSGSTYEIYIAYRYVGTTTWNVIADVQFSGMGNPASINVGLNINQSYSYSGVRGRLGCCTLMSLGTWADRTAQLSTLSTPVVDPRTTPYTHYMDLVHGSDSVADLTKPGRKTAATFSTDAQSPNCGFFRGYGGVNWKFLDGSGACNASSFDANVLAALYAIGVGKPVSVYQAQSLAAAVTAQTITAAQAAAGIQINGDTVYLNDSSGKEQPIDAGFTFSCEGIQLCSGSSDPSDERVYLSEFGQTTSSSWTLDATNRWKVALSALSPVGLATSGLYQNRRPLNLVTSTTLVASTVGSFYNDGTNLYVHPFDGVDPTTSASSGSFEYSGWITDGVSIMNIVCDNALLRGLRARGNSQLTSAPSAYAFQFAANSGVGGLTVLSDCDSTNNSRHETGQTYNGVVTNHRHILMDTAHGKGGAWCSGPIPFVDFINSGSSGGSTGNQVYYERVKLIEGNVENPGTTGAQDGSDSWLSHINVGTGSPFSKMWFIDCDWSLGQSLSDQVGITSVVQWGSKFGQCGGANSTALVTGCQFYRAYPWQGVYTSCVFPYSYTGNWTSGTPGYQINSSLTATLDKCTVDFAALVAGFPLTTAIYWKVGSTITWSFTDCWFILPGGAAMLDGATHTDTISFKNCKFQVASSSSAILSNYNDGTTTAARTLAQLQTLGICDSACSIVTSGQTLGPNYPAQASIPPGPSAQTFAALQSIYSPPAGSNLIAAGADNGLTIDATLQTFAHRTTVGAYEPVGSQAATTGSLTYGNFPSGAGSAALTFGNFKQS